MLRHFRHTGDIYITRHSGKAGRLRFQGEAVVKRVLLVCLVWPSGFGSGNNSIKTGADINLCKERKKMWRLQTLCFTIDKKRGCQAVMILKRGWRWRTGWSHARILSSTKFAGSAYLPTCETQFGRQVLTSRFVPCTKPSIRSSPGNDFCICSPMERAKNKEPRRRRRSSFIG